MLDDIEREIIEAGEAPDREAEEQETLQGGILYQEQEGRKASHDEE